MRKYWSWSGMAAPHARVVLMVAGALDDGGLAVEQKSLLRIESHGPDAEGRLDAVYWLPACKDGGHKLVEFRRFGRP